MTGRIGWTAAAVTLALALAGCSRGDGDPRLMNLRSSGTPDEFAILPTRPLEAPPDYRTLPEPTPGGGNRTDPTPQADAVAALGGRPSAMQAPGRGDAALLAHAGRYGTDPGIRQELASADLDWRRAHKGRLLERLFGVNVYFNAYEGLELDQHAELARLRRLGIKTPAAPPDPALAQ